MAIRLPVDLAASPLDYLAANISELERELGEMAVKGVDSGFENVDDFKALAVQVQTLKSVADGFKMNGWKK